MTVHPAPEKCDASERFRVAVEGHSAHVYPAEVAAEQPFRRWPHPMERETVAFTCFDVDGPATVAIRVLGEPPVSVRIRPRAADLSAELDGDAIRVRLSGPGNYVVELDGDIYDHLYLFANPPEAQRPDIEDPNVTYFGPGFHEVGRLQIERDDQTVYLAGGAVVNGCIWARGVDGLRICGRGVLLGTGLSRGSNMIRTQECTNARIEDITIVDAPCWTIRLDASRRVEIDNVRQISYMQNSDGIDPCSSENVLIENVFIRSYDDGVVVKAMRGDRPSRNIRTRGGVFITDHATTLKIGNNETLGPPITDIVFEDCDILSCRGTPMGVCFNGPSCVGRVRFENIRVEASRLNPMRSLGRQEDGPTPQLIYCGISMGNAYLSNYTPGAIRDVVFRDIRYHADEGGAPPTIRLAGHSEASSIADITLENIVVDQTQVAGSEHPSVDLGEHVYNVRFVSDSSDTVIARRRDRLLPMPEQPPEPPLPPSEPIVTESGDILIEAETGRLGQAIRLWSNDANASEGWYVMPAARSNFQSEPPGASAQARYEFTVETAATYGIQALVRAATSEDNSFWVRVDDGPWIEWTAMRPRDAWVWREVGDREGPLHFDLSAGRHTLTFAAREDGAKLDRLRLRRVSASAR